MPRLSAGAMRKLEGLEEARRKLDHLRSLVEQAAGYQADMSIMKRIGRTAADAGRVLDGIGYGALAQTLGELGMIVRRTTTSQAKIRTMRELVAAARAGLEQAERNVQKVQPSGPEEKEEKQE